MLEEVYTSADGKSLSMAFVFRKVLEEKDDKAIDKRKPRRTRTMTDWAENAFDQKLPVALQ